jgi:hypothetical protein
MGYCLNGNPHMAQHLLLRGSFHCHRRSWSAFPNAPKPYRMLVPQRARAHDCHTALGFEEWSRREREGRGSPREAGYVEHYQLLLRYGLFLHQHHRAGYLALYGKYLRPVSISFSLTKTAYYSQGSWLDCHKGPVVLRTTLRLRLHHRHYHRVCF